MFSSGDLNSVFMETPSASASLSIRGMMSAWDSCDSPWSLDTADSNARLSNLVSCVSLAIVLLWRETGDL